VIGGKPGNVVLANFPSHLHSVNVEQTNGFGPDRGGIRVVVRIRALSRAVEDQADAMLARKLVVVDVEEVPDVCRKVGRVFTEEPVFGPIILKRTYLLQADPFQLTTGVPTSFLRRGVCFSIVPR
jgi:hypothetical protein